MEKITPPSFAAYRGLALLRLLASATQPELLSVTLLTMDLAFLGLTTSDEGYSHVTT